MNFLPLAKRRHFPGENHPGPLFEALLEIVSIAVEPLEGHHPAAIPDQHLKDPSSPRRVKRYPRIENFADPCLFAPRHELRYLFQVSAVFIASGKKIEGVFSRPNSFFLEERSELGPTPFTNWIGIASGSLGARAAWRFIYKLSAPSFESGIIFMNVL